MSEEILINVAPMETRVALIDNGVLQEVYLERFQSKGLVGNIYCGKVARVMPGMQAAFVDIGLDRAAFIHVSDMTDAKKAANSDSRVEDVAVNSLVKEGDSLVVQVIKDPIGSKGARLTMQLSVSSRYLVFMPNAHHIGISQRIESEEERQRLYRLVEESMRQEPLSKGGGFIVRTVAEGASQEEILRDVSFLARLWKYLEDRMRVTSAVGVIHEDLPLYLRTMRDLVKPGIERVRIDSEQEYQRLLKFSEAYDPRSNFIEYYQGERPIFDLYGIEDEIGKALETDVQLKSGGHIILEQTEAMTTVDVNTGAFLGHRNLEETIYKTNLEAATAIARQLRLRNLGGIIIIDFIDMKETEHRRQVLRALEKALEKDRAKTKVLGVSELGLVEMTRKRTRESLGRVMCEPCIVCHGKGQIKSAETVCYEIFREILREAKTYDSSGLMVMASQAVIDRLLDEDSATVADLEKLSGKTIRFQVESIYAQDQYDVVLL
jgi:ribonuclease G